MSELYDPMPNCFGAEVFSIALMCIKIVVLLGDELTPGAGHFGHKTLWHQV